jgi:stage V sporulation protein B
MGEPEDEDPAMPCSVIRGCGEFGINRLVEAEVGTRPVAGGDSIRRNTAFGAATQLTTAAFTAVLTIYLVRALGPDDYGIFALAVGIGGLLSIPSDFGVSSSTARFIAEHRGDMPAIRAMLADALKLKLAASSIVAVALFLSAGAIANLYDEPDMTWPLRGVGLAVLGQSIMLLYHRGFTALGRVSITWRITLFESALEATASFALVIAGAGATGAAFGRAAGYLFGASTAIFLTIRLIGRRAIFARRAESGRLREIMSYAGALFLINASFTLFDRIDILLIGAYLNAAAVAVFEAPLRLIAFLSYGGQAVALGVAPRVARHRTEGTNVRAFEAAIRYLLLLQAALLAPILVWSDPIVDLVLGSGYEESAEVLRALAPFMFFAGVGTFITLSVNFLGEARRRVPLAIGAVLLNLVIDLILIPDIGVLGGAIGTDIAFTLYVLGHFWIAQRVLHLDLRPVVMTFVRCLAAAAAMTGVLALFGTSSLSPVEAIVGAVAGITVYLGVLSLLREVSLAELRGGWGALRSAVASLRPAG